MSMTCNLQRVSFLKATGKGTMNMNDHHDMYQLPCLNGTMILNQENFQVTTLS